MPRFPRPVLGGIPYHVTQRGNRRCDVFFTNTDRFTYLDWLGEYCSRYRVGVLAYCLMPNHVHAVVVPETETSMESVFRALHTRYALRINRLKDWKGHLWQGRYFSAPLDEPYLYAAVRYVERNPVRANLVSRAEDYRWSSAASHCGKSSSGLLMPPCDWLEGLREGDAWSAWLAESDAPATLKVLRENARRGQPCGSVRFIETLEQSIGRELRPRIRGRPRKTPDAPKK